jgi:hypothetical protein
LFELYDGKLTDISKIDTDKKDLGGAKNDEINNVENKSAGMVDDSLRA